MSLINRHSGSALTNDSYVSLRLVLSNSLQTLSSCEAGADLVMSDIAPNITGTKVVDQPRSMYLVELALDMARRVLKPGGNFVCKVFQGAGFDEFLRDVRNSFERVKVMKPKASRPGSREVYLVARNFSL